jgi:hypothetical protein
MTATEDRINHRLSVQENPFCVAIHRTLLIFTDDREQTTYDELTFVCTLSRPNFLKPKNHSKFLSI